MVRLAKVLVVVKVNLTVIAMVKVLVVEVSSSIKYSINVEIVYFQ